MEHTLTESIHSHDHLDARPFQYSRDCERLDGRKVLHVYGRSPVSFYKRFFFPRKSRQTFARFLDKCEKKPLTSNKEPNNEIEED